MENYAEFQPYLESVKDSGSRSRSVIYVNIILIAIGITMLRNYTYPMWDLAHFNEATKISRCLSQVIRNKSVTDRDFCDQRLQQRFHIGIDDIIDLNPQIPRDTIKDQKYKGDVEEAIKTLDRISQIDPNNIKTYEQAKEAIEKLVQAPGAASLDPLTKMILHFLDEEVDEKVKKEYFDISIFGISLHQNDSWMVTGVFNAVALVILRSFMRRELENIKQAAQEAKGNASLSFLLLSTQVFATPDVEFGLAWLVRNIAFLALYFLPFAIQSWIVIDDISQSNVSYVYGLLDNNVAASVFEYICELGTLLFLCFAGWRCYKIQFDINDAIIAIKGNI